jgi:hypothetical protein
MKQISRMLLLALVVIGGALGTVVADTSALSTIPVTQMVAATDSKANVCEGIGLTGGSCGGGGTSITKVVEAVINILSIVVGVVAVIMIIFGGFKYITSGGDTAKVASAKNTIVYAIVGLVVVALAQTIVHFVLSNVA